MPEQKAKILLVEDDRSLARVVHDYLTLSGFEMVVAEDGKSALEEFGKQKFDLALVDVMLPKMDGYTLVENMRKKNDRLPILFLTSKSAKEDKIKGFTKGADDFITKPFEIEELVMRIKVFLKRSGNHSKEQVFNIGEFVFDFANHELNRDNKKQKLTRKEAHLLHILCINKNQMVKRDALLKEVWGSDDYFLGRSMDVYISKLRKYLSADKNTEIENHHGVGFRLIEKSKAL